MRIGELAAQTGLSVQAIRFYERRGLLDPARLSSGYRDYTTYEAKRIRFIKKSQQLGYTLTEIRELLQLSASRAHNAVDVGKAVEARVRDIDNKIRDLKRMRSELISIAKKCGCGPTEPVCRVLRDLDYEVEPNRIR